MKKNDVLLLISALLFSGLFYRQSPGLNFLLFALLLAALLLIVHPEKIKDANWWYYCSCACLNGFSVFANNSVLSVLACIPAFLLVSGKTVHEKNSIAANFLFACYSVVSSFVYMVLEMTRPKETSGEKGAMKTARLAGSILLSLGAVIVFFYLYRVSNPLFKDFTNFIDLKEISFGWICFTLLGLLILYGLTRSKSIGFLSQWDITFRQDIAPAGHEEKSTNHGSGMIAFILFIMLNLMLLITNALDFSNIYISQKLPAGITLSDFVHQAVEGIIFSIVMAVALITFFFSGDLNFSPYGKKIKLLVYAWIIQSAMVVINTMIRNSWYIQEFQLTYLRIGVFLFLGLCLFGLAYTWIKVARQKSAWQLANLNFQTWFAVLVFMSLFNWDKIITNYNISHSNAGKALDVDYLTELSDANLPELVKLHNSTELSAKQQQAIYRKVLASYKEERFTQWQSFNWRRRQNTEAFNQLKLK